MIPTIESIVEMLIAHECTAQDALRWIGIHMENSDLRDHFAAKAMQNLAIPAIYNIVANDTEDGDALVAKRAYEIADQMLKAREA